MNVSFQKYIFSLKPRKVEHCLLLSIFIYTVGSFLFYHLPTTVGQIFRFVGFLFFLFIIFENVKNRPFSGFPLLLYILLLIDICFVSFYTFFIADSSLIGASFYEGFMEVFSSAYFFPSILPFMLLLFPEGYKIDLKYFVRLMTILGVIYLLLSPFALTNMLLFNFDSSLSLGFNDAGGYGEFINNSTLHISVFETPVVMYFWKKYLPQKQWLFFLFLSIIALFIGLYMARRGRIVIYLSYYILCYLLYLIYDNKTSKLISLAWAIGIVLLGFIFVIVGSDSFLSLLFERGTEDTRSEVEHSFFRSIDFNCLIYGRGWFGAYFDDGFGFYRKGLETGYLTLIIRGGIIYLFLYVSLLLYSVFKGLFFSRSIFVKSFAVIIFMSVLALYPYGWPAYDFYFFVIWIGVFICNNDYYLRLTDFQVKLIFSKEADILILWLLNALYGVNKQRKAKDQQVKRIFRM